MRMGAMDLATRILQYAVFAYPIFAGGRFVFLHLKATQDWLFSLGNWTVYAAPGPVVAG